MAGPGDDEETGESDSGADEPDDASEEPSAEKPDDGEVDTGRGEDPGNGEPEDGADGAGDGGTGDGEPRDDHEEPGDGGPESEASDGEEPGDRDRGEEEPAGDDDGGSEAGTGGGEPDDGEEMIETGPQTDQEMPLTEHIEEMVRRLGLVVTVGAIATVVAFPLGEEAINFLWYSILPGTDVARPHLYNPLELVFTQLKVASLGGLVVALPVLVYQTYRFMRPGLYPHERRYYLAAVPASLVLAFVGLTFAYFVVLPAVFTYFYSYSQEVTLIAFSLGQTFNLILVLMGYLAIVFQIPLLVMLAIMMGIASREWLAGRRLLFWSGFVGVAFVLSPDPTGVSPIIIGVTMILLFEGSLLLAKWAGH